MKERGTGLNEEKYEALNTAHAGNVLSDLLWGLERETHRVTRDGAISLLPHTEVLQAPRFTRDFAESQLEIVTSPHAGAHGAVSELEDLTRTAARSIGSELLWPFSMPPALPDESRIPVARFGPGEAGRRAELYRRGLALRYGAARQMICGVHLNVSFGPSLVKLMRAVSPLTTEEAGEERASDGYALRLLRNLYGDLPLFVLLLGASPVRGGTAPGEDRLAVSFRNSIYGYAGREFRPYLDLRSLRAYVAGIKRGLRAESAAFSSLGLVRDGTAVQLNGRVFQSEKEFYAPIRLRQDLMPGETTVQALSRRGVGRLELRFLDVDPFTPGGVSEDALRLFHLAILDGLARPSVPPDAARLEEMLEAAESAALLDPLDPRGPAWTRILREAELRLAELGAWAGRLSAQGDSGPLQSLKLYRTRIADPILLTSARLAHALRESGSWTALGVKMASETARRGGRAPNTVDTQEGGRNVLEYAGV